MRAPDVAWRSQTNAFSVRSPDSARIWATANRQVVLAFAGAPRNDCTQTLTFSFPGGPYASAGEVPNRCLERLRYALDAAVADGDHVEADAQGAELGACREPRCCGLAEAPLLLGRDHL